MIGHQRFKCMLCVRGSLCLSSDFVDSLTHPCCFPLIIPNPRVFLINLAPYVIRSFCHICFQAKCAVKSALQNWLVPENCFALLVERKNEMLQEHEFFEG